MTRRKARGQTARQDGVMRVALALMEPLAAERLGERRLISPDGYRVVHETAARLTRTREQRDDFLEQARLIALTTIDSDWPAIEALANQHGIPLFVDSGDWPVELADRVRPLPEGDGMPTSLSAYDLAAHHMIAHGLVATALSGKPASVGFSGFRGEGRPPTEREFVRVMLAGGVSDTIMSGEPAADIVSCDCHERATWAIVRALGIVRDESSGTVGERLAAIGQLGAFEAFLREEWKAAWEVVLRFVRSGLMAEEAERLSRSGRIKLRAPG